MSKFKYENGCYYHDNDQIEQATKTSFITIYSNILLKHFFYNNNHQMPLLIYLQDL